jgi:hypothetical protein
MLGFVLLVFPDGRLLSRRWRPVAWVNLFAILLLFAWNFKPGTIENVELVRVANPFGVAGAEVLFDTLGVIGFVVVLAATIAGAISAGADRRETNANRSSGSFSPVPFSALFSQLLPSCGLCLLLLGLSGFGRRSSCWA